MCDAKLLAHFASTNAITRRRFGALSAAGGAAAIFSRAADAQEITASTVDVPTADGIADCHFVHPTEGRHPGVVIFPDARGLRLVYRQMSARLAEAGYSVLVLNPYYRGQRAPVLPEGAVAQDPDTMAILRPLLAMLNTETQVTDATALLEFIDRQPSVDSSRPLGVMGYCLGGPLTMRGAAAMPDRVGAGASFHGIQLATDAPDSPHLLVPKMQAGFLFAIAEDDDAGDPDAKVKLRQAFDEAGLFAEIEVYAGANHSWCTADSPVHNPEQAERAWGRMFELFERTLKA
jgi:carboxymethylenebutenolidase